MGRFELLHQRVLSDRKGQAMISLHKVMNVRVNSISHYGDTNWFSFNFDMEDTTEICFYAQQDSEAHYKLVAIAKLLMDWEPPVRPLTEEEPVDATP
jgi:hypothetical protein